VLRTAALLACLTGALAACGSGPTSHQVTVAKQCPAAQRALARIAADTAALHAAKPGHATDVATDRFLLHVDTAPISNLQRNRLIDHAAAAVATKCPQCFQALESARPIPAIRAGESRCPSR